MIGNINLFTTNNQQFAGITDRLNQFSPIEQLTYTHKTLESEFPIANDEMNIFVSLSYESIVGKISQLKPSNTCYICSNVNEQIVEHSKNLSLIGIQRHLLSPKNPNTDKIIFLGDLQDGIKATEPLIRDSELLIFDFNALRRSEVSNLKTSGPSGIYSEQATQLFRYAGMTERNKNIVLLNYSDELQDLLCQLIWYYAEAAHSRFPDHPYFSNTVSEYVVELVSINKTISFFKSKASGRWWVKVPEIDENRWSACNYEDYESACNDEISHSLLEIIASD